MRTNYLFNISAAFFVATFTTTFAQSSWETVDNLAKSRGRDIVADSQGNFISLAIDDSTNTSSPVTTAVSVSADHGSTWQTVGSIAGYALDLAVAPDGALFATGNRTATVSGRAFLWQSLDHGATWTVCDPSAGLFVTNRTVVGKKVVVTVSPTTMLVADVAAGNSGAVYVCGQASSWIVRKGLRAMDGSISWTTVDTLTIGGPASVYVRPGTGAQADEVLVCGGGWTVRRSLDGGATWTTLDSTAGSAFALTTTPDGAICVVGRTATSQANWLVRRSVDNGAAWANVDYVANGWPQYSITADAFGRVFAVGFNNVTPRTWLVRGSTDGGATWTTTDLFLPSGATSSQADAVAVDGLGNVCVVGELYYGTTVSAPIRRLGIP
jgi:hypothetical protein